MLDEYRRQFALLKKDKYSVLVHRLRKSILLQLNKDTFECGLVRMSIDPTLGSSEAIISTMGCKQSVILFDDAIFFANEGVVKRIAVTDRNRADIEQLKIKCKESYKRADADELKLITLCVGPVNHFSERLRGQFESTRGDREPFTDYAEAPEQISQIKKIINALYHVEKALVELEAREFRDVAYYAVRAKVGIPEDIVLHVYEAAMLATHLDIDLSAMFGEELAQMTSRMAAFQNTAAVVFGKKTMDVLSTIDLSKLPHQVGVAAGTVVDLMGLKDGDVDYDFITKFSAVLPDYINKLTKHIQTTTSDVSVYQPTINKKKLAALKDVSLKLLQELEKISGSSIFMPLKTLNFIYIIKHAVTLSMNIFEQIGHLNTSSQDYVRDKLKLLKYDLLPELFGLADKIEQNALLRPGLLSNPLMASISQLYQGLTDYAAKLVEFSKKGQELVTVEDTAFVQERLGYTFKRIADNHRQLLLLGDAERASHSFFDLLNREMKGHARLIDLPDDIRKTLAGFYKVIEPHMRAIDLPLNNAIIGDLAFTSKKSFMDRHTTFRWAVTFVHPANMLTLLLQKNTLDVRFKKTRNTLEFNNKLNEDIVHSVSRNIGDLKLFEVSKRANPFNTSTEDTQLTDIKQLPMKDVSTLFQLYQKKCIELDFAKEAFDEFNCIMTEAARSHSLDSWSFKVRNTLRNLYGVFQPYLMSGATLSIGPDKLKALDEKMVALLSMREEFAVGADVVVLVDAMVSALSVGNPQGAIVNAVYKASILTDFSHKVDAHFEGVRSLFVERCGRLGAKFKDLNAEETEARALVQDPQHSDRAHHLIKHQEYSKAIATYRRKLGALTKVFNRSIRAALHTNERELPYPELMDANSVLAQSAQVLGLKQVFNCLYHLEHVGLNLEKLRDDISKSSYVQIVAEVGVHFNEARLLVQALMTNPSLFFLVGEIKQQLQSAYTVLTTIRPHYFPLPVDDELDTPAVEHDAVFYILNALMVLPGHIKALRNGEDLSQDNTTKINLHAEKTNANIKRILKNSSSFFKLFLEIPTMYRLFGDLKGKLAELSNSTHDAVITNLAGINNNLLMNIILEGDQWESKLGLESGTLTKPMKEIFDALYQGLLEPLNLTSKKQISLVSSSRPIDRRVELAMKQVLQVKRDQSTVTAKDQLLNQLLERIGLYRRATDCADLGLVKRMQALIVDDYNRALPILKAEKKHLPLVNFAGVVSGEFVLLPVTPDEIKGIDVLAKACRAYFEGLCATHQQTRRTAEEKMFFLSELRSSEVERHAGFVDQLSKRYFKERCLMLSTKSVGLIHCGEEYGSKLKAYMEAHEKEVVEQAKKTDDINQTMGKLLQEKAALFEIEHYKDHYHLDTILSAIDQLNLYLSKSSKEIGQKCSLPKKQQATLFEHERTMAPKIELAGLLKKVATDKTILISKRLCDLKEMVEAPSFKTHMLKKHAQDTFSLAGLLRCILSLLELLRLYTPEHKKCYKQLVRAVERPSVKISHLAKQYGLFCGNSSQSSIKKPKVLPDVADAAPGVV